MKSPSMNRRGFLSLVASCAAFLHLPASVLPDAPPATISANGRIQIHAAPAVLSGPTTVTVTTTSTGASVVWYRVVEFQ